MIKQGLFSVALALATATLAAQAPKPSTSTKPTTSTTSTTSTTGAPKTAASQPTKTQNRYVPAIMQDKMIIAGCLKRGSDWELTDATITGQKDKATYRLEGISAARLSLFVGKRVEVTGALQNVGKPATGKSLPLFEATAVQEATGNCS
jgi:hypothetical protein